MEEKNEQQKALEKAEKKIQREKRLKGKENLIKRLTSCSALRALELRKSSLS